MKKMIVNLTSRNQITIPKSLINELGFNSGDSFNLVYKDNKFILEPLNKQVIKDTVQTKPKNNNTVTKRKIVSNLVEGQKFKVKYYSDCGLVIRTKNSYLKQFCQDCKGQLLEEHKDKIYKCPYSNKLNNKDLCNNIKQNVNKLQKTIDNKINNIKNKDISKKTILNKSKTTVNPVRSNTLLRCDNCGEFFYKGFNVDKDIVCTKCFIKDFKAFLKDYNKIKE